MLYTVLWPKLYTYRESSLKQYFQELDEKLPPGSAVLLVGLVDGRVLWDNLGSRQHPIGTSYSEVYTALECNEVIMCFKY